MGVFPPCVNQCFLSRGIESIPDQSDIGLRRLPCCVSKYSIFERGGGKVEEIMLGLQDQLVADTEEAIRPQDRRRKLIKHDPIFLPGRRGKNTSTNTN